MKLYRQAAEAGCPEAMVNLGRILVEGKYGVARDVSEAMKLYRQAADAGHARAMFNLAMILHFGKYGVARDIAEAMKWYRQAADAGETDAMSNLGTILENGAHGIARDVGEAMKLYRQAAEAGCANAMYNLGVILQTGEHGVAKDVAEAMKLLRQAVEAGNPMAMKNLGGIFENGKYGVKRDVGKAMELYRQAAADGNAEAMTNLALILESGKYGVPKDVAEATKLYHQAADLGLEEAVRRLSKIHISENSAEAPDVQEVQATESNSQAIPAVIQPVNWKDHRKYEVFISHAGPDKLAMAEPICTLLVGYNVAAFLDTIHLKIDDRTAPEVMERAMEEADIGIFVLSPEFASRRWTMKELRCFLRRDEECRKERRRRPVLLPIFFRLSIAECRQAEVRVYGKDSDYEQVVPNSGFFEPERQAECSTEEAIKALQEVTAYSGVEVSRYGGGEDLSSAAVLVEAVTRVRTFLHK